MSGSRVHSAARDVFFGTGVPSTIERLRRDELEVELEGDETVLEALFSATDDSGRRAPLSEHAKGSFNRKTVTPTQRRSCAKPALGPSPLSRAMPSSSSASSRAIGTSPQHRQAHDLPRKSVALIDFEGKLASPCRESRSTLPAHATQSLLDDPFSPWRPVVTVHAETVPLGQSQVLFAGEQLISNVEQHDGASPVPLQQPCPDLSNMHEVGALEGPMEKTHISRNASAEECGTSKEAIKADAPVEAVCLAMRRPLGPAPQLEQRELSPSPVKVFERQSFMRAKAIEGPPKMKAAPRVVLRAVDAMKGQQSAANPSAAFVGQSRSRIAQSAALRGPAASNRLPLAGTSRLPALARSALPAKPQTVALKASEVPAPEMCSPLKAASSAMLLEPSPKAPLMSTSRSASPGAVQRAAERIFGVAPQAVSASVALAAVPQRSLTRRPLSPRRTMSPRRRNSAVASPKNASPPRRPASPGTNAGAISTAFGQPGRPKGISPPETCAKQALARRKTDVTAPAMASLAVTPLPVGSELKEAIAAMPAAQMQQLTNRHTTRNAAQYNRHSVVVDRRSGPRPPSPSARLRKQANYAARNERAKKRQAMQETAQRANFAVDAEEAKSQGKRRQHARGAGDDGIFESPAKRRKQVDEKALKWDRGLYTIVGEETVVQARAEEVRARHGILKAPRQLDQHGNALNAKAPLSPLIPRESVLITKIIYDDDDDEGA